MTQSNSRSTANKPSVVGLPHSRGPAEPEELRQKILRPYFPLLHDWLKHDLESVEVPESAELEGRCVMLGSWEKQQLKAFRIAPAFGLKPDASLVLESVAFQFAAGKLEQCFETGPMPEADEIPRFLDEMVAQLAVGIALESLLQKSVDDQVQQGKLTEAKLLTEFRGRIVACLADLKARVGSLELDRAEEAVPSLIVTPKKTRDPAELEDEAGLLRMLEEIEEPLPGWASFAEEESRQEEKLPPWLHDELVKSAAEPRPQVATGNRVKPMLLILAALLVVYALVIWPRVSEERPPLLEAGDFVGIDVVREVRARPPSLFIVVDGPRWDEAEPETKIAMVEAMGVVADQAGYSGLHVRADQGRVVAGWLKNNGVAIRQASDGGS